MTHKQRCIAHAMQYLKDLGLEQIFDSPTFNYFYNKMERIHRGGNPFIIGMDAADLIIQNCKPQNISYEYGNES